MKKIFLALLAVISLCSNSAYAGAKTSVGPFLGCNTVYTLPHGAFVYKNSAPLRNSRGVMVGLRYQPTLIMKSKHSARSTTLYSAKGKKIGSCPWAAAHGFAGGRMRCTMPTSSLRRAAVASAKKASVYFTLGGGLCAMIPDAGACYGSNKGGCSRVVK